MPIKNARAAGSILASMLHRSFPLAKQQDRREVRESSVCAGAITLVIVPGEISRSYSRQYSHATRRGGPRPMSPNYRRAKRQVAPASMRPEGLCRSYPGVARRQVAVTAHNRMAAGLPQPVCSARMRRERITVNIGKPRGYAVAKDGTVGLLDDDRYER